MGYYWSGRSWKSEFHISPHLNMSLAARLSYCPYKYSLIGVRFFYLFTVKNEFLIIRLYDQKQKKVQYIRT
jgi:hypothetical protein